VISCNGPANEEIGNEECQLKMRVGSLYATLVRVAVVASQHKTFITSRLTGTLVNDKPV
jgi:hypothetical protein